MSASALKRICAWCEKPLGERACSPEMDGKVTDGICPECACAEYVQVAALGPVPGDPAGFWPVVLIAGICGLTAAEIVRFKPKGWMAGLHFVQLPERGEMWREAFLGEVFAEMAVDGARDPARRLMNWLCRDLPAVEFTAGGGATGRLTGRSLPPRTSPAPAREPAAGGWLPAWEGNQP